MHANSLCMTYKSSRLKKWKESEGKETKEEGNKIE